MDILEQLEVVSREAKSDGNRAHYHVANNAANEIKALRLMHERLKVYEKVYGKIF